MKTPGTRQAKGPGLPRRGVGCKPAPRRPCPRGTLSLASERLGGDDGSPCHAARRGLRAAASLKGLGHVLTNPSCQPGVPRLGREPPSRAGALPGAGAAGPRGAAASGGNSRERWWRPPSPLPHHPLYPPSDRCPTSSTSEDHPPPSTRADAGHWTDRGRRSQRRSIGPAPCGHAPLASRVQTRRGKQAAPALGGISARPLEGGTSFTEVSLTGNDARRCRFPSQSWHALTHLPLLLGERECDEADVVVFARAQIDKMASSGGQLGGVFDHHVQRAVCDTRAKYREGRRPRAVRVKWFWFHSLFRMALS